MVNTGSMTGGRTQGITRSLVARNPDTTTSANYLARDDVQVPPSFIQIYPDVVSASVCAEIIERFENDPRVRPSWGHKSDQPENRTGMMLDIGYLPEWQDLIEHVMTEMEERIHHYAEIFLSFKGVLMTDKCYLTPPLMERITTGQGFDWHCDGSRPGVERRILANILYLANVSKGGETQFAYQRCAVTPAAGSMVIFPPFWTHLHRGTSPVLEAKYNITNFVDFEK